MTRADLLRGIAQRCFELARQHHGFTAENLHTLGREYDAKATELDRQSASGTAAAAGDHQADSQRLLAMVSQVRPG